MTSTHRRAYVDWARGIAVLLMIEAHTFDAWTRLSPSVRRTIAFRDATVLGGFAAPLFLWLAGLAVVLAATRAAERSGSRARRGRDDLPARPRNLHPRLSVPAAGIHHHARQSSGDPVPRRHPQHHGPGDRHRRRSSGGSPRTTARAWRLRARSRPRWRWLTPIVRASPAIDAWPLWLQWYMRPFGDFTIFTLFPWAGFVFAGARSARCSPRRVTRARSGGCRPPGTSAGAVLRGARLLHRRHGVDLRVVVVLDQLADLVRDPRSAS